MKLWRVTHNVKQWSTDEIVEADYLLMPNGALVFKRAVRHSYPEIIKVFAPGVWDEVVQL